ncbi:MAG: hypothetical protein GYA02_16215 [Clostridiaceae bacterium]|nr:hypothetical protein [Clostridiaceae bacterium]
MIEVNIQIRKIGCRDITELNLTTQEFISLRNIFNTLATAEKTKPSRFAEDDLTEILKAIYEE